MVSWSVVSDAASYVVEWDTDVGFASPSHGSVVTTGNNAAIGPLADDDWLWRVSAKDAIGNASGPSATDSFTVDTLAPQAGTVILAAGADFTRLTNVALSLTTGEPGLFVELGGDIAEAGGYLVSAAPVTSGPSLTNAPTARPCK